MRERELKLDVPPAFRRPPLEDLPGGLTASPAQPRRTRSTYLDTEDLRLVRWGCTVRFRSDDGWTVKLPETSAGEMLVREERRFQGRAGRLPADAADLITAYVRSATLRPVVILTTAREPVEIRGPDGSVLAEVDDDRVSVMDGRRVAARFREVEVEVRDGLDPEALACLVGALREAGAGPADLRPKLVRALGERASAPHELTVPRPRPGSTAGEVVRAATTAAVERLLRHDPLIRLGEADEAVHQARVATRRLRSDLKTFAAFVDPEWAAGLRAELRWIGGALGSVRDADVLLARLRRRAEMPRMHRTQAMDALIDRLAGERAAAREVLRSVMRSERYVADLDRLVQAATAPQLTDAAAEPARPVLTPRVEAAWTRLRDHVRGLDGDPEDEALHRARVLAKRARYAGEAVEPVVGRRAHAFAKAAARLQDALGEHQDAVVARAWLMEAARTSSPARAFAAGELAAHEVMDALSARRAWRGAWKSLAKRAP